MLDGRYRLDEPLGSGGMSEVWRAYDVVLDREVAVKLLPASAATGPAARDRVRAEAQAAARLWHPHVTNVYDYGEAPGPYVVMELLPGRTLAERLADGPLPPRVALRIVAEVAAALAAAHAQNLVHRDVKPSNVMLTPSGAKVLDFGIAAVIGSAEVDGDGLLRGTPAYLAPERLTAGQVSAASDVYALGLLIHRVLTNRLPWLADTTTAMLDAHVYVEPEPLPAVAGVPDEVTELCARCLAKEPAERPSAAEAAAVLATAAGIVPPPSDDGPPVVAWGAIPDGTTSGARLSPAAAAGLASAAAASTGPVAGAATGPGAAGSDAAGAAGSGVGAAGAAGAAGSGAAESGGLRAGSGAAGATGAAGSGAAGSGGLRPGSGAGGSGAAGSGAAGSSSPSRRRRTLLATGVAALAAVVATAAMLAADGDPPGGGTATPRTTPSAGGGTVTASATAAPAGTAPATPGPLNPNASAPSAGVPGAGAASPGAGGVPAPTQGGPATPGPTRPSTPAPEATRTTAPAPGLGVPIVTLGGIVTVRCLGTQAEVVGVDREPGYDLKDYDPGPADEIQVVLEAPLLDTEVEVKAKCANGLPVPKVKIS